MNLKKLYLERIEELGITPNFFISETYINQPSIVANEKGGWLFLTENEWVLFPAVPVSNEIIQQDFIEGYWAGFPAENQKLKCPEFVDYQYIYNPKSFLDLSGGKWETFRKNIRKFENANFPYYTCDKNEQAFWVLMEKWFARKRNVVQDGEFILECLQYPKPGDYIRYLYDRKGNMVAVNYADENYKYINYRFIICDNIQYADEYARFKFYTDPSIQEKNKLVNDGGILDNIGLKRFKDKLNPTEIHSIYSHSIYSH